jgi:DnaJ-class molecular chaperone
MCLQAAYKTLQVNEENTHEQIREAFLDLTKRFHPDSGSCEASAERFSAIKDAYMTVTENLRETRNQNDVAAASSSADKQTVDEVTIERDFGIKVR